MEWSVNNLFENIVLYSTHFGWSCYTRIGSFLGLDPDKWNDLKKGLNYNEDPIQKAQQAEHHSAPFGIGIWFEMFKIFLMLVIAAILIYFIVRLISGKKIIPSNKKRRDTQEDEWDIDLPSALSPLEVLWQHFNQEREAENYRECLRILYQIALKKLGDNGWIQPKQDKTNYEYINELTGKLPAADFAVLTAIFEFTWYGDATIRQSDFKAYAPKFMDFIRRDDLEK